MHLRLLLLHLLILLQVASPLPFFSRPLPTLIFLPKSEHLGFQHLFSTLSFISRTLSFVLSSGDGGCLRFGRFVEFRYCGEGWFWRGFWGERYGKSIPEFSLVENILQSFTLGDKVLEDSGVTSEG
jgi:hypothetical protein